MSQYDQDYIPEHLTQCKPMQKVTSNRKSFEVTPRKLAEIIYKDIQTSAYMLDTTELNKDSIIKSAILGANLTLTKISALSTGEKAKLYMDTASELTSMATKQ